MVKIQIIVNSCSDLPPADLNNNADPFVKVEYGFENFETPVLEESLHPVWSVGNEFVVDVDETEGVEKILTLRVYDHNEHLPDDSMGKCKLDLDEFLHRSGGKTEATVNLALKGKGMKVRMERLRELFVDRSGLGSYHSGYMFHPMYGAQHATFSLATAPFVLPAKYSH